MLDVADRHPSTQHFVDLFEYDHLPPHLQSVSKPFAKLAQKMVDQLNDGPELTAGLRKLVEAKDCCVRQALKDHRSRVVVVEDEPEVVDADA